LEDLELKLQIGDFWTEIGKLIFLNRKMNIMSGWNDVNRRKIDSNRCNLLFPTFLRRYGRQLRPTLSKAVWMLLLAQLSPLRKTCKNPKIYSRCLA
jgi:hypothetical protein